MGQMDYEEKSQSCCTWFKVGVVGLALIVTGILIWQFAPIDNAINNVLPTFNNTASQNLGSNASSLGGNATSPPTSSSFYEFMKCADPSSPDCCNGLDGGFCDMRVNEVLYATSHNANADFESGFFVTPNHQYKLEESLKAGYRGINVDVCNCGGQLQFCHGICNFGTRDVIEVLTGINDFLDENPSEVLILPIEINSGVDQPVDIDEFYGLMLQVPGFVEKFYEHQNATAEWPTLGQLVQSGQVCLSNLVDRAHFFFSGMKCSHLYVVAEGHCLPVPGTRV